MRKDWTETTLGEIASLEYGKPLKEEHRDGEGFPVFGSAGQVGLHSVPLLQVGPNIVVGRKGTAGAVIWTDEPCSVIDTAYYVSQKSNGNLRFLFLALENADLPSMSAQTGVPGLNRERAYSKRLSLPPLVEQRRIVDVIESVDTYINALETRAATARTARSALLHELLSAGGEGWTETTLGEVAAINPEATSNWPVSREFRYVDLASVSESGGIDLAATQVFTLGEAPGRARRVVRENDVIVSTVRPYLRGFARVPRELEENVASTGFAVLRSTIPRSIPGFVWATVRTQSFVDYLVDRSTGSNYPAVRPQDISAFPITLPPLVEQRRIVDVVESVDGAIAAADVAAADARDLRSALLSDLLSGDHEIPESYDRFLAAA